MSRATIACAALAFSVSMLPSARAERPLNRIVATIPVGSNPSGVVVSPDSSTVYVANNGGPGTISVIYAASNTVKFVISTDFGPTGLAISPDGSTLYALCVANSVVDVISTVTQTVTSQIDLRPPNAGASTGQITLSPDGSQLYYPDGDVILVIDTSTQSISTINFGDNLASQVVFTAKGAKAYVVAYQGAVVLSLVDTASQSLVSTQKIGGNQSAGIVINPAAGRLYVSSSERENGKIVCKITTVDAATAEVLSSNVLQAHVWDNGLSLTTDGKFLYVEGVPKKGVQKFYTVDTATGEQVCDPLTLPGVTDYPVAMAPNGKRGYIVRDLGSSTNGVVTVIALREK